MSSSSLASQLVMFCRARHLTVTTAESCTGGMVAAAITAIPGASEIFFTGFVTYANSAKTALLDVPEGLLEAVGAVSEAVARRMAINARLKAGASLAIAVTGIAGPGGGSVEKPVGTVYFGLATASNVITRDKIFSGDRAAIRAASTIYALTLLLEGAHQ
jgi:nicotinamide-nucleotide amidase